MPLVSICIPAYKQINFLKKCIQSILIQNYTNYELIITDDTPDDTIRQFLNEILKNKSYTYLHNKPSLGSPANWNKAVSLAKGEYIKIMHHDDCFANESSLAEFVNALDKNSEAVFAFSNSLIQNQTNFSNRVHSPTSQQLANLKNNPTTLFLANFIGAPSATIFRSNQPISFDTQLKWLVDVDFYIQLLTKNNNFIHINKALVSTTDGALHQITSQCINNPTIELKENCLVFDKLDIPENIENSFINYFCELFNRFDINNTNELNKYYTSNTKKAFYENVFSSLIKYKQNQTKKRVIKSLIKNSVTLTIYKAYKSLLARNKIKGQLKLFKTLQSTTTNRFTLQNTDNLFCAEDNTVNTTFDRQYVYHLAWATRVVKQINPTEHTDISSLLFFPTMLSAFVKVNFYDFRPAQLHLDNLESKPCDLTKLHFQSNSIQSLSCMHTVEHIGLGRYGDPLDYDGDLKAINELKRVVAINGHLLFVVPIGKARIQFNAHRIYSYKQILSYFNEFQLKEFALIPDNEQQGGLIRNATEEQSNMQSYACGCFWFIKK
jgi:glycosyltransferase involved in cell wall biosynthesis